VFTHEDWQVPKTVTINTDSKISKNVAEEFRVTAGNIPLSWAVVLGFTGGLLIVLALYHMWSLPYAKGDLDAIADRPPFYVPLLWLGLTIGIPFAGLYFGAQAVGWVTSYVAKAQVEQSNERWEASVADARARLAEIAALKAAAEAAAPAEERPANDESAAFEELPEGAQPLVAQLDPNILDEERRLQQQVDRAMAKKLNVEKGIVSAFNIFNYLIFMGVFALWMIIDPYSRGMVGSGIQAASNRSGIGFAEVFQTFFQKEKIGIMLAFILLFRLGESQIVRLGVPFLLDSRENGGLALSVGEVGLIYQTIGVLCLLVGGIIGGYLISRHGLRKVIWPLVACMHLPNLLYVYLAYAQPENRFIIGACVGVEQLGYGIGFASFMMYLIYAAQGNFKTSHYALCTGFMALGMLIPMSFAGAIQAIVEYPMFFILAFILVLPGVMLIPFMPLDANFGRKSD
jgi:PAT family beta-lactamase induction signal transducer AmpG